MTTLRINTITTDGERLLLLLHGYGADEYDLAPLTPHIDPGGTFSTFCPRAPLDIMGFGAGWYERRDDGSIDPATFMASVDAVDDTIDELCEEYGFDRAQAVVVGFSQGGAMTLATALREGDRPRPTAIACLSGMLQQVDGLQYAFTGEPGGPGADDGAGRGALPAILVHHGTMDPVVPIDRGHKTRDILTEHGVDHVYREYPMQHEISPASIADLRDWLASV